MKTQIEKMLQNANLVDANFSRPISDTDDAAYRANYENIQILSTMIFNIEKNEKSERQKQIDDEKFELFLKTGEACD